jgi:hypothetical protein
VVFKPFLEAINVYDAYSEILPEKLKMLCTSLDGYDIEIDLYGKKEHYSKPFALTSKSCRNPIISFERTMKPQELNIVFNIKGDELRLADVRDIIQEKQSIEDFVNEYAYYFRNILDTKTLFDIIVARLKNRVRKYF